MALEQYRKKRDFSRTPEPAGAAPPPPRHQALERLTFVVQKHDATRLHYDFRLELDGVLKSWAVPKGPSLDPHEKRLAVHVEDHPIEYGGFEGIIPAGEYGGGTVIVWDRGIWASAEGTAAEAYANGKLKLVLLGDKLRGGWTLVRMTGERAGDRGENWLLIKENDDTAAPGSGDALVRDEVASVVSGLTIEQIAADPPRVWSSSRGGDVTPPREPAPAKAAKAAKPPRPAAAARRSAKQHPASGGPEAAGAATGEAADLAALAAAASGARRAALPASVEPQLATLVEEPPAGDRWLHEIKFDGYRVLCELRRGKARLLTRTGKDWSERFAPLAAAVAALPVDSALLDGEVTVLMPDGTTSFQALQEALGDDPDGPRRGAGRHRGSRAARAAPGTPPPDLVYFAFDLLYLDGWDLRGAPLAARKEALRQLLDAAGADAAGPAAGVIRWSDHVTGQGADFFRQACRHHLEGIVSKRADLPYHPGRSKDWLKIKCLQRQELVVGGFTDPEGSRQGLGALLLGVYDDDGQLRYAGKVGTGFDTRTLLDLRRRLTRIERRTPAFADPPHGAAAHGAHWVEPELVAEVAFAEWTRDGQLRHPAFQGLREDKEAIQVRRETPQPPPAPAEAAKPEPANAAKATKPAAAKTPATRAAHAAKTATKAGATAKAAAARSDKATPAPAAGPAAAAAKPPAPKAAAAKPAKTAAGKRAADPGAGKPVAKATAAQAGPSAGAQTAPKTGGGRRDEAIEIAGVRLTHPDRVLYPDAGITKRDLALFYESIADWALPHLAGRPLTLVRCPDGQGGECFYQKHVTAQFHRAVRPVPLKEGGKTVAYPVVDSAAGLVALVQMGVLEMHIWGSHEDDVERPDYLVFDLDPDDGLPWDHVTESALELRDLLAAGGLTTFLKTTGGKGLHVVLPLGGRHTWEEVKTFTHAVADRLAAARPDRYTANPLKAQRKGRIYLDYLRNARGATSIAAYSCRSRPGAPVSTPLAWDELGGKVRANTFTVANLGRRLARLAADPWEGFDAVDQSLTAALKRAWGI